MLGKSFVLEQKMSLITFDFVCRDLISPFGTCKDVFNRNLSDVLGITQGKLFERHQLNIGCNWQLHFDGLQGEVLISVFLRRGYYLICLMRLQLIKIKNRKVCQLN